MLEDPAAWDSLWIFVGDWAAQRGAQGVWKIHQIGKGKSSNIAVGSPCIRKIQLEKWSLEPQISQISQMKSYALLNP
jgi:hypothetical protein